MALGIDYNSGIPHTNGAPTHDPGTNGGKLAYDHVNRVKYKHVSGTTWEVDASGGGGGDGIFDTLSVNNSAREKVATFNVKKVADVTNIGGTASLSGLDITGVGTSFLTDFCIGDRISFANAPATYARVNNVYSNTSLSIYAGSSLSGTAQTINRKKAIVKVDADGGQTAFFISDEGKVGIGALAGDENLTAQSALFDSVRISTKFIAQAINDFSDLQAVSFNPRALIANDGTANNVNFNTPGETIITGNLSVNDARLGEALQIKVNGGVPKEVSIGLSSSTSFDTIAILNTVPTLKVQCPIVLFSGEATFATPSGNGIAYDTDYSAGIAASDRAIPDVGTLKAGLIPHMPRQVDNSTALNGETFYSTDNSKLCFKDLGGTVNDLY